MQHNIMINICNINININIFNSLEQNIIKTKEQEIKDKYDFLDRNIKTKIILNMEDEEAQRVKTILRLSETEVMNITHFQRGNGLISTNNNNITVEFKASNLEKELITTDRQELLEILKRQDKKVG